MTLHAPKAPLRLRIFIVENHADTLLYLGRYLEMLGHEIVVAHDMTSALERIPKQKIDLLISDIGLPDGDGWELMRRLEDREQFFAMAMSGCGLNADKVRSKQAGFRHHLIKPFLPEELDPILAEASQEAASRAVVK